MYNLENLDKRDMKDLIQHILDIFSQYINEMDISDEVAIHQLKSEIFKRIKYIDNHNNWIKKIIYGNDN